MKRRKLTEILIETVETIVIARRPKPVDEQLTAWCAACGQVVILLAPDAAATLADIGTRTVFRQVEAGQWHFIETAAGRLWLCSNSVQQAADANQSREQPSNTKEN